MGNFTDGERAHSILLQHQFNENRVIAERTSLFLLSNSVLLIAFAMLVTISEVVCTILSIVGLVSCVAAWFGLRASTEALEAWIKGQRQIEKQEGGVFAYMRKKRISPQIYGLPTETGATKAWKLFPYSAWLIFAVWVAALFYIWCLS